MNDMNAHELPFARLMDRVGEARQRLTAAAPEAAAFIAAEFGKVEDEVAELATDLARQG